MATRWIDPATDRRWLGALVGWRASHGAATWAAGRFIFYKIAVTRVILNTDTEAAFDVHVIG